MQAGRRAGAQARLVLILLLAATPLHAQLSRILSIGAGGGSVRLRTEPAVGQGEVLSGSVIGTSGALTLGIASLELSYLEGNLTPDSGTASPRDIVDGAAFLAVRPVRWVALKLGVHLRSYVIPSGTERWLNYEARLRGEGDIIGSILRAHVELARSVSADVNIGPQAESFQSGEAGLVVRLTRAPVWARLSYVIDQAKTAGGGTETLDGISLAIGYGAR